MSASAESENPPRPWIWATLFVTNMALIAAADIFDVIEQPVPLILIMLNMCLLAPMIAAARQRQEQIGAMSPALRIYNNRALACMFIYMVAMIAGGNLYHVVGEGSPLLWPIAIVPVLPLLGMIWTMYRYYQDEQDEFLRHRAVTGALVGLVLVLVTGTVWGFFEMYGLVPHIWNWWVFPVWAIGLGLTTCLKQRDGSAE